MMDAVFIPDADSVTNPSCRIPKGIGTPIWMSRKSDILSERIVMNYDLRDHHCGNDPLSHFFTFGTDMDKSSCQVDEMVLSRFPQLAYPGRFSRI